MTSLSELGNPGGPPPGVSPVEWMLEKDPPTAKVLDPGIRDYVLTLNAYGVATVQSCEGGIGHSYPVPSVDFLGDYSECLRALSVALLYRLPVSGMHRVWNIWDCEIQEQVNRLEFRPPEGGYKHEMPTPFVSFEGCEVISFAGEVLNPVFPSMAREFAKKLIACADEIESRAFDGEWVKE